MKRTTLALLAAALLATSCRHEGCTDTAADNYDSKAKKNCNCCEFSADMIFWMEETTKASYLDRDISSLKITVPGHVLATIDVASCPTSSPSCGASGFPTATVDMKGEKWDFKQISIQDQNSNILDMDIVELFAVHCTVYEIF